MVIVRKHAIASAIGLLSSFASWAQQTPPGNALETVEINGARQRLDVARNGLSPETGSSIYRLNRQDIDNLPQGDSTPLNQVILQTPGVVQDSHGQIYVRGDHGNVQYRINGVNIPESISGFGQALETRFADRISILTGALPAQYGYRTAAVVDIQSKGDRGENGGRVGLSFGSRQHVETSVELSGSKGNVSYYLTGSFLRNNIGVENPTPERSAIHDQTRQTKGFGSLSYVLNDANRVSLLFGSTNNRFQIPNLRGETPSFMLGAMDPVSSDGLDANQRERNKFIALSYQGSAGEKADYQISVFRRSTDVHYQPDSVGDLTFRGIAADVLRLNVASGVQADMSYRINADHTLRSGLFAQSERFGTTNNALVFPADADGNQTSTTSLRIEDDSLIKGNLWGVYLQDEWRPVKSVTINYGLRYDRVNTVVNENQLSPRIGLVYDFSKDLRLHAGYSRYFTPPPTEKIDTTTVQKFLGTTNALPSDANTAVRSERSHYFDAGLEFQLTPKVTLGIDGYYRKVKHLQDEGQFGNALIFSSFNYEKGKIFGLDLSATYRDRALTGYVNLGLTHARGKGVETGQFNFSQDKLDYINSNFVHLDHEQALAASAGVSYKFAEQLTLSASALYGSGLRRGFANTEHLPSYLTLNIAALKTFGTGSQKVDTRIGVVNLFDRTYQLRDGSGIGVGAPQFGMRRTLFVGLTKSF